MQLKGNTISFNGINSSRYGLYLCSVGGGGEERSFGVTRSIEAENGSIKAITEDTKTIEIQNMMLANTLDVETSELENIIDL